MSQAVKLCIIALLLFISAGCLKKDLDLQIRFNENPGIKADDPVLFEGNPIGIVRKVSYTKEGSYLIHILVESDFKNAATVDSKFYIVKDPKHPEKMNLLIEQSKPGGNVLEDGAMVEGADQRSFLDRFISDFRTELQTKLDKLRKEFDQNSEKIGSGVDSAMNSISIQFEKLGQKFSQLPEREDVKALGESLSQLRNEMMSTEKSIRNRIQTEIIPQIEQEVENLKKRLAPLGRDKEVEALEDELDRIKKV